MTFLAFLVFAAGVVAVGVTRWLLRPESALWLLDYPNARSLHDKPVPRTGGVAILAGLAVGFGMVAMEYRHVAWLGWVVLAVIPVAAISYLDDRQEVPIGWRLAAHSLAAAILLMGGFGVLRLHWPGGSVVLPLVASMVISWLQIVWFINLYNFMDGMDGFAGGMAIFGFAGLAGLGGLAGDLPFVAASLVMAASAAGFLVFNFPPARIFMGDTGSAVLGLLVAAFFLYAQRHGIAPLWVGILLFSPFFVDASVTLARRMLRGEAFWRAHREHYYQRVVQLGWGHRKTVLVEYGLMVACTLCAVGAVGLRPLGQWGIISGWILLYAALAAAVAMLEKSSGRR